MVETIVFLPVFRQKVGVTQSIENWLSPPEIWVIKRVLTLPPPTKPHFSWFSSFGRGRNSNEGPGKPGKAGIRGVGRLEEEIPELLRKGARNNVKMASPPNITQTPAINGEPRSISLTWRSTDERFGSHDFSPNTFSRDSIGFPQASFISLSHCSLALSHFPMTFSQAGSIFLSHSSTCSPQYSFTFSHCPITFSQDCAIACPEVSFVSTNQFSWPLKWEWQCALRHCMAAKHRQKPILCNPMYY